MAQIDTPLPIEWEVSHHNRGPVVRTMSTEFAGVRYLVSVETTGRRSASKRQLDQDGNSIPISAGHPTDDAAVEACIKDMGFERHEVAISFSPRKQGFTAYVGGSESNRNGHPAQAGTHEADSRPNQPLRKEIPCQPENPPTTSWSSPRPRT